MLRTRRNNSGGDPPTTGAKRTPNSRDGARCDAAFQKKVSRKVAQWPLFAFLTQLVDTVVVFDDVQWYDKVPQTLWTSFDIF